MIAPIKLGCYFEPIIEGDAPPSRSHMARDQRPTLLEQRRQIGHLRVQPVLKELRSFRPKEPNIGDDITNRICVGEIALDLGDQLRFTLDKLHLAEYGQPRQ